MEVLTRPPPHQDAPMDLTTTAPRMLSHAPWPRHTQLTEPRAKALPLRPNRYIPIPKKRHCHAPQAEESLERGCQSPSPVRQPPRAAECRRPRHSLSPEMSRKRARMESPKPSDLWCDSPAQPPPSADTNDAVPTSATSPTLAVSVSVSSSGGGGGGVWPAVGAGPAGANGEVVVGREGVTQSVMKPRQRGHPSSADSSYATSPPGLMEDSGEGVPSAHLFTALLHMQGAALSQGMMPTALKDTEALLSAVHQSQMLYYSYCSQLIQSLRTKQIEEQHVHHHQQHQQQHKHQLNPHHHHHHQLQPPLHQHPQPYHHGQPHHPHHQDHPRLNSESEFERRTPLEEPKSYESEDAEEDLVAAGEDDTLSILRTRLNHQEGQQLCLDQRSPSAESPSGTLPSSTTGGEDMDLAHMEAAGGARKRAPRALTGKHVRPGTGASASTLFTLRQKLQERQKYREVYGVDPPQPTKATKGRAKKR